MTAPVEPPFAPIGGRAYPFEKVLIANRGEIACRIARTLRERGLGVVAAYHAVERQAAHLRAADEAVELTGETPVSAYLDIRQIVEAAQRTGAQAIHPGYGFLSENAGFAAAVEQAGLVFIGPDSETIRLMGDKISAREFAEAQGVPVAPSVMSTGDLDAFRERAEAIGYPLLIKAAAGGGGKGMSIVRAREHLAEAAQLAVSEAQRYFGDGRVYAETYIERPRHIEVQIAGDGEGRAIHLFERECSVQRRFQKIVEEAPAANLSASLRDDICGAAVRLSQAARYRNLGTVEFILGADGRFFFLEMNTRLQVEHSVTEMITGLDLVGLQLDIAAGFGLGLMQSEIRANGAAIEVRVCAENPDRDFLPETGVVRRLDVPRAPWLRFENALVEGQKITADFDSLLAKLVAQGRDREEARTRLVAALEQLDLLGVTTNIDYLARVLAHPAFQNADLHTGFVTQHAAALALPALSPSQRRAAVIAAALGVPEFRQLAFGAPEPYASIGPWRN